MKPTIVSENLPGYIGPTTVYQIDDDSYILVLSYITHKAINKQTIVKETVAWRCSPNGSITDPVPIANTWNIVNHETFVNRILK